MVFLRSATNRIKLNTRIAETFHFLSKLHARTAVSAAATGMRFSLFGHEVLLATDLLGGRNRELPFAAGWEIVKGH
jgi:hypothetical protein